MSDKESKAETWYLEWENNIKGRPFGYREDQIITSKEWKTLEPREQFRFTKLSEEEKRAYVQELRRKPLTESRDCAELRRDK